MTYTTERPPNGPERTLTLTDFLLARIADDEEAVVMPQIGSGRRWQLQRDAKDRHLGLTLSYACPTCHVGSGETCIAMTPPTHAPRPADGLHATRQDLARASLMAMRWSARVLAECEAKRRIVEAWALDMSEPYDDEPAMPLGGQGAEVFYDVLRALALPYADHPDYRDEWRP